MTRYFNVSGLPGSRVNDFSPGHDTLRNPNPCRSSQPLFGIAGVSFHVSCTPRPAFHGRRPPPRSSDALPARRPWATGPSRCGWRSLSRRRPRGTSGSKSRRNLSCPPTCRRSRTGSVDGIKHQREIDCSPAIRPSTGRSTRWTTISTCSLTKRAFTIEPAVLHGQFAVSAPRLTGLPSHEPLLEILHGPDISIAAVDRNIGPHPRDTAVMRCPLPVWCPQARQSERRVSVRPATTLCRHLRLWRLAPAAIQFARG